MATPKSGHDSSQEVIDQLLEEERRVLEAYRERAARNTNAQIQLVLNQAAELRARYYAELRSRVEEMRANDEITREMNEMFW